MKITIFAALAVAALVGTGCVGTVSETNTFATTWSQDSVAGRYKRTVDQVYQASITVVSRNGVISTEYIPHDTTNNVRSLEGRVNDRKVWVRVSEVDPTVTEVAVEARTKWGVSDIDLVHELEKEIALELAAH